MEPVKISERYNISQSHLTFLKVDTIRKYLYRLSNNGCQGYLESFKHQGKLIYQLYLTEFRLTFSGSSHWSFVRNWLQNFQKRIPLLYRLLSLYGWLLSTHFASSGNNHVEEMIQQYTRLLILVAFDFLYSIEVHITLFARSLA